MSICRAIFFMAPCTAAWLMGVFAVARKGRQEEKADTQLFW